jgi:hypothetical protein
MNEENAPAAIDRQHHGGTGMPHDGAFDPEPALWINGAVFGHAEQAAVVDFAGRGDFHILF